MAPTLEKVTFMTAEGSKVARRSGTIRAPVKWASMATMPKAGSSEEDWALTKVDRKERATVVAKNNIMGVDSCEGGQGGGPL